MSKVQTALIKYLAERVGDAGQVTMSSDLINDIGLDSLDTVDLANHMEDELGIDIDNIDIFRKAKTVGDLIEMIRKNYGFR